MASIRTITKTIAPYRSYYDIGVGGALQQSWFLREETTEYETGERVIITNIPTPANDGFITIIRRYRPDGVQFPDERIDHPGIYPPVATPPITLP
jgi:hypothetical protein